MRCGSRRVGTDDGEVGKEESVLVVTDPEREAALGRLPLYLDPDDIRWLADRDICGKGHTGSTPLAHRNIVRRGLEKATEATSIGEYVQDEKGKRRWRSGLRWHDLRHTAASLLIGQGLNVVYVSRTLGHADPSITLNRYAHLWDAAEHGEQARVAMDAAHSSAGAVR